VAKSANTLHVSVVTPEGAVLEIDALQVVFPAHDGEYGILPNHAPLLSLLGIGELRVSEPGNVRHSFYVERGFAEFSDNQLTLLTEEAVPVADLEVNEAEEILEQARNMTVTSEEERVHREATYERGRVQRRLAREIVTNSGV
jgi:F-type H+-transporting ATPase subunit epsilon